MRRRTTPLSRRPKFHPRRDKGAGTAGGRTSPTTGPVAAASFQASDGPLNPRGWFFLLVATACPIALLALRVRLTGTSGHLSLPWDLFLGWVPVLLSLPFAHVFRRPEPGRRMFLVLLPLALGWLLFFPNAPYLVTEVIHLAPGHGATLNSAPAWLAWLSDGGPHRRGAPVWLDLLLLTSVAGNGALLTIAALRPVHGALARRLGRRTTLAAVAALLAVTSFGVAIGRFDRFNSWDVFAKPGAVAERLAARVLHPGDQPGVTACTLVLTAMLIVGYFGTREVARPPGGAARSGRSS